MSTETLAKKFEAEIAENPHLLLQVAVVLFLVSVFTTPLLAAVSGGLAVVWWRCL